ncbi:HalOD1 output domain-containing protein [Halopiger goleimassiliensis]|uniref:HalOD1 output domain-containing protein n=1 Tax=Halopiger goleimassiliensis TaxID=1293048 RepID=UPI0006777E25|nr:HalOD1 output domain-containing protein [Halopiger goleimassiliensis]
MAPRAPSSPSDEEPLSVRVVQEIAAYDDVDPMDLSPPLYSSIDPTALDALFESTSTTGKRSGQVTFEYEDKRVAVASDGSIEIEPQRTAGEPKTE